MKNLWLGKLAGHITVKIEGKGLERFINKLIREKVRIWNVKRQSEELITFQMFIKDVSYLREAAQYHRVKVRFIKKAGFPFYIKRMRKNTGFFIGASIALIMILLLSNMIWNIQIKGASPEVEYKINNQLKHLGVKKGNLQFLIDDPETLQRKLSRMNEDITWIGVELKGTTYHFQVVEKEQPEEQEKQGPQHIIAKKEAVIVDYFIEKGQPVISVHDFVKPGQLLVSGIIGKEDKPEFVSAKGEILGKTWYNTKVEVQLKNEFELLTGKEMKKTGIKIGNFSIPIWGLKKEQYKQKKIESDETYLKFFKWTLPIAFVKTTIREVETHEKTYTDIEAEKLAFSIAKKDLVKSIPKDAQIVGEKVLHQKVENGKLKLLISYDVIENIAKAVPINPKEEKKEKTNIPN